ncbi:MAG: bifunctional folylpolyglutamate synthase/dihydrofolate synthase [Lachnospiraceae bacterium]|nr:bifunctional folylpolyglutamate synthase/dihydrofolate synthase [Lachnospiraceae bacterium]
MNEPMNERMNEHINENMNEKINHHMNYQEALDYVEELKKYGSVPGLASIQRLCGRLGNPQDELEFIHIAGTNGKGSVLAFCSEILKASGYRAGRYLSPTIFDYRERIQIGARPISKKDLCLWLERIKGICEELTAEGNPHPTAFEIETAMAFAYFREQNCDIVVLETGLGGLLDATNIVKTTVLEIITSISFDHMGVLGNSLSQIAEQKAGIMKPGSRVAVLKGEAEVMEVLERRAKELSIPLAVTDPSEITGVKSSLEKQSFCYKGYRELAISMAGIYQLENAALAVSAMEELNAAGFPIKERAVYRGLLQASWQGRFQVLGKRPFFIADGAHNRGGAQRLAQSVQFYFTNRRIIYIIGILRDKEQDEILRVTCPLAEQILTVPTPGERGLSAYELACMAREYHGNVTATDSVQEAVELAYLLADKETVIVAFGSLSYLGNLIKIVKAVSDKESRKKMGRDSHGKQRES